MTTKQHTAELVGAVVKGAPSAGVSGLILLGYPVQDWVVVITGLYTLLLAIRVVWTWPRKPKEAAP